MGNGLFRFQRWSFRLFFATGKVKTDFLLEISSR
jgi:hypothetical protein